jgi:hypothetical protein
LFNNISIQATELLSELPLKTFKHKLHNYSAKTEMHWEMTSDSSKKSEMFIVCSAVRARCWKMTAFTASCTVADEDEKGIEDFNEQQHNKTEKILVAKSVFPTVGCHWTLTQFVVANNHDCLK